MAIKNRLRTDRIKELKRLIPVRAISYAENGNVNVDLSTNLVGTAIDGVTLAAGDYIGLFAQSTATERGIYEVRSGAGDSVRRYDLTEQAHNNDASACDFMVSEGTVAANSLFSITNNKGSGVVGVDSLTVTPLTGSAATNVRNGIRVASGFIELGGDLVHNTFIGHFTNNVSYGIDNGNGPGTYRNNFYMRSGGLGLSMQSWDYVNDTNMQVQLNEINGVQLRMTDTNTSEMVGMRFLPNVTDYISVDHTDAAFKGLMYASDVSANFENESLITKRYVDNLIGGRMWKNPVRVCVDGTNLTGNVSLTGAATVDGVTLATGDRIACFDQTTATENGIYVVDTTGAWTRASDFEAGDGAANATFFSQTGTVNTDVEFTVTNNTGSDVIGTDTLVLAQTGSATQITAGAGMIRNGSAFDVVAADLSLQVNADDMQVNIGNTNGTSLEVSATGLELVTDVTGARTFSHTNTELGITATDLTFADAEINAGAVATAIPFAMTPTVDYGGGNTTVAGGAIDQFRADFTDDAVVNALVELKAMIDSNVPKIQPVDNPDVFTLAGTAGGETLTALSNLGTHATNKVFQVKVYWEGGLLLEGVGNEYTIDRATGVITTNFTADAGDTIQVYYFTQDA